MTSLKGLSDRDLLNRLRKLVRQEHDVTLDIVRHLVEVERRGLYAAKAYNSLFEYCRGEFGYSDASAWPGPARPSRFTDARKRWIFSRKAGSR